MEGDPNHTNVFSTINIDIESGMHLDINNILLVNEKLINAIKRDAEFINRNSIDAEGIEDLRQQFAQYNSEELISGIKSHASEDNDIDIYFTQDSLGVSLPVSHELGDYANFEIGYELISDYLIDDLIQAPIKEQLIFSDAQKNNDKDIANKIFKQDIRDVKNALPDERPEFALHSAHADISDSDEDIVFIMINSWFIGSGDGEENSAYTPDGKSIKINIYSSNALMYVCSSNGGKWNQIGINASPPFSPHFFKDNDKDRIFVLESSTDGYHDIKWYNDELAKFVVFKYDKKKKIYDYERLHNR